MALIALSAFANFVRSYIYTVRLGFLPQYSSTNDPDTPFQLLS